VGAVSVYFDTNVLVALFSDDALTRRADKALRELLDIVVVSDLTAAEFAAVVGRRVRTRKLPVVGATAAFLAFDDWCARDTLRIHIESIDVAKAAGFLRRFDLTLRTPDALHIAMAQRISAQLLTFDKIMASAARALGIAVLAA
jgi:predicted nucleic acid-binding protein